MWKISLPPGFDPRTIQPVGSRYTAYATRPIFWCICVCVCACVCVCIYIYIYSSWSRVTLEKLTGFAASQEIPRIYVTRISCSEFLKESACVFAPATSFLTHFKLEWHAVHDDPLYFVCPDLLRAVVETSDGIRVEFIRSTHSVHCLFMYLFVFKM
jgi:hypothetical protein